MKNNYLALPAKILLKTKILSNYRFRKLILSFTILLLFAIIPSERAKGQIVWPIFTVSQSSTNLCNGSVDFSITGPQPLSSTYSYQWKINNVAPPIDQGTDINYTFSPNQNGNVVNYNITCEITSTTNIGTYTNTIGPYTVSSVAGLYVKRDPTYVNTCSTTPTLDASINGSSLVNGVISGIIWYSYDPATNVSTQIASNTQYLTFVGLSLGSHYYYYTSTQGACAVQSGMYQVNVVSQLTIVANNANLEPGTVLSLASSNITTPPLFTNLNWYRNGQMIPGATSTSYTTKSPGVYSVYELYPSSCGGLSSNTISITCDPVGIVTKTNFIFNTGITNLSGYLKFDGTITVPAGATVNINSAQIHMTSCSEIIIMGNTNSNQAGGKLNLTNSSISGCGLWKWIKVAGNNGIGNPVQNGLLTLDNTQIRDATVAIYTLDGGTLNINNTILEDNRSHLAVVNCPNVTSSINNTTFSYLKLAGNCNIGNIYPTVNANYNTVIKMVYLSNASGITFSNSNFNPSQLKNFGGFSISPVPNAIEAYNCNKAVNAAYSFNIQSCSLQGIFNQGIYASHCESPLVNGTTNVSYNIEGDFTNVFYFDQCSKPSISYQKMHPGSGGQTYFRGILSYQSDGLYCYSNKVDGFDRGLEFYQQIASSNKTTIVHNAFLNNDYGVVIAPEVFPVNNNANPNLNAAYYNNQRNVLLNCNKFYDCNWGVAGVGNIIAQSTANGNNNDDWDCFFTSNMGSNNYSKKADVAWYDYNSNINAVRKILVYYDRSGYPFTFSAQSITLDGNTASSNNYYNTYVDYIQKTSTGCRNSFKTDPIPPMELTSDSIVGELKAYPNPFNNSFSIKNSYNTSTYYILYDITGKIISHGNIAGQKEIQIIGAALSPTGCYLLKMLDPATGESFKTTKLIKISE